MDELSFWDREGHAYVSAPSGDCIDESLQFANVASVGRAGYGDRKIVDVRDHKSFGDRDVSGGDL